jgi:hypothetical protein
MLNSDDPNEYEYVRVELYRVNLHGPGDFFKEHKDTPQAGTGHFGSLVLCLPTQFEGGAFIIQELDGKEVKFDWGTSYASVKAIPNNYRSILMQLKSNLQR